MAEQDAPWSIKAIVFIWFKLAIREPIQRQVV